MNKVVDNVEKALVGVQDGMTLMVGGFGLCGIPENSIAELVLYLFVIVYIVIIKMVFHSNRMDTNIIFMFYINRYWYNTNYTMFLLPVLSDNPNVSPALTNKSLQIFCLFFSAICLCLGWEWQ
jgi:hypothetical protein